LVEAVQFMTVVWEVSSWHFGETASDTASQWQRGLKAWVCSRSLSEIVGSNPAGCMKVCLLWVLWVVR